MILDIVFVRHGLSCANTLAKAKYGMHLLYPDPELAQKGVEMSKLLSSTLIKNINVTKNILICPQCITVFNLGVVNS